jgi:hypothetical protein
MSQPEQSSERLWSFPQGMLASNESIKDFEVEASDGHAGKVSWASYAPGESYLVVSHLHHLHEVHHVVPAGAVEKLSVPARKLWLRVSRAQIEEAPLHHDPPAPLDHSTIDAFESATSTWSFGGDMF